MWAAEKGRTGNIALLIKHGAQVNAVSRKGFTPLVFAMKSQVPEAATLIMNAGADTKSDLPDGSALIEAAIKLRNFPVALELVSRGVDINRRDKEGRQLIHLAALSGSADLVKAVLAKGADPNVFSQHHPGPYADPVPGANGGAPPLLFAAMSGSLETMKVLVAAGAQLNARARVDAGIDRIYSASDYANRSARASTRVFFIDFLHERGIELPRPAPATELAAEIAAGGPPPDVPENLKR